MKEITKELLKIISDYDDGYKGAYNIREDGKCVGRFSSENIIIKPKNDKPGLEIYVKAGTKGETVSIPACVTEGDENDLVYNDFYIGENANVIIVAGCGIHNETGEKARHNGIHQFFLEKNSKVKYIEKHIGIGKGSGGKVIDPETKAELKENSILEMDTVQISGIDVTHRLTSAVLGKNAKLFIKERIMTEFNQVATTDFTVELNGDGSGVDLISRSVAKDNSHQAYRSEIIGNAACTGHSECDAIISNNGRVDASPILKANNEDAALIHEAAIGKIAGEQIIKLRTFGLTEKEAEDVIIQGFLQ